MSRLLAFAAGAALASLTPVAAEVQLACKPVFVPPPVKCDPTALRYNRAPLECHRT